MLCQSDRYVDVNVSSSFLNDKKIVLSVCHCDFCGIDSNAQRIATPLQNYETSQSCLCILLEEQILHIYTPDGKSFHVPLPCRMKRMWAFNKKILMLERDTLFDNSEQMDHMQKHPILFSLIHPLEELKPISVLNRSQSVSDYNTDYNNNSDKLMDIEEAAEFYDDTQCEILFVNDEDSYPLVVAYNHRTQVHQIFNVHIETATYNQQTDLDYYGEGYDEEESVERLDSEVFLRQIQYKRANSLQNTVGLSGTKADTVIICDGFDGQALLVFSRKNEKCAYVYRLVPTIQNQLVSQNELEEDGERINTFSMTLWESFYLCCHKGVSAISKINSNNIIFSTCEINGQLSRENLLVLLMENSKQIVVMYGGEHRLCNLELLDPLIQKNIIDISNPVHNRLIATVNGGSQYKLLVQLGCESDLTSRCFAVLRKTLPPNMFASLFYDYNEARHLIGKSKSQDSDWESFSDLLICLTEFVVYGKVAFENSHGTEQEGYWDLLLKHSEDYMTDIIDDNLVSQTIQQRKREKQFQNITTSFEEFRYYLPLIILSLHLLYESFKVNVLLISNLLKPLAIHLYTMSRLSNRFNYCDLYLRDFLSLSTIEVPSSSYKINSEESLAMQTLEVIKIFGNIADHRIALLYLNGELTPNIFQTLYELLFDTQQVSTYPIIKDCIATDWIRKLCRFYHLFVHSNQDIYCPSGGTEVNYSTDPFARVTLAMVEEGIVSIENLRILPFGISIPLRQAIDQCRSKPPLHLNCLPSFQKLYQLLGRQDLLQLIETDNSIKCSHLAEEEQSLLTRDVEEAENMYYNFSDSEEDEDTLSPCAILSIADEQQLYLTKKGLGHMVFHSDKRLKEVYQMLNSSKPLKVKKEMLSMTEEDLDRFDPSSPEQQHILQKVKQRILSLSIGRGMLTFATKSTQPTDTLKIPPIVLIGNLKRNRANIVLDMSQKDQLEYIRWSEYHNGVAAGLCLQRHKSSNQPQNSTKKGITREWIVYHRPKKPSFSHAGLLLALGLQGHLAALAPTDVFNYLCQRHEATTISMLIGLSASKKGTQDPYVTRTLSLHIPSLVLSDDLEMPIEVQSSALIGIGLLYLESSNRFMSEVLMTELARAPNDNNTNGREGYSLAAGIGLGLVCLGQGTKTSAPSGLSDLNINDRLCRYMAGGSRPESDPLIIARRNLLNSHDKIHTSNARVQQNTSGRWTLGDTRYMNHLMSCSKIQESDKFVNVDVTGPGACLALTLMYLKSHNELIAKQLAIPNTKYLLECVRPDMVLLRIMGANLVMWDNIQNNEDWLNGQIPPVVVNSVFPDPSSTQIREEDEYLQSLYAYMLAGCCFTLGLRYAGSHDAQAAALVNKYLLQFESGKLKNHSNNSSEIKVPSMPIVLDKYVLEYCLIVCLLALSCIVSGSGDTETVSTIRRLRRRFTIQNNMSTSSAGVSKEDRNYGPHLAISMALGLVFLGGGRYSLSTNPLSIASLICALYPRFPISITDNQYHLQAFRHMYALAAESRLLEIRDVDTEETCLLPFTVKLNDGTALQKKSPCLIPEIHNISEISVSNDRFYPLSLDLKNNAAHQKAFSQSFNNTNSNMVLYVKKKTVYSTSIQTIYQQLFQTSKKLTNVFSSNSSLDSPQFLSIIQDDVLHGDLDMPYIHQDIRQCIRCLDDPRMKNLRPLTQNIWNLKLLITFYQHYYYKRDGCSRNSALFPADFIYSLQEEIENAITNADNLIRSYLLDARTMSQELMGCTLEWFNVPSIYILKQIGTEQKEKRKKLTLNDWTQLLEQHVRPETILIIYKLLS